MLDSRSYPGRIADRTGSDLGVRSRRASSGPASIDQESLQSKRNGQERLNTNNSNRLITKRLRVVFFGDRQDPFARSIADAIPRLDRAWDCPDLIPDLGRFGRELGGYHVIVAHRANPRPIEIERLAAVRTIDPAPPKRIILCSGDYLRYREWNRVRGKIDAILAETSARETIALHVDADLSLPSVPAKRSPVAILGGDRAIHQTIAEACRTLGRYPTILTNKTELLNIKESTLIWINPTVERDRFDWFSSVSERSAIVALIGCADRVRDLEARRLGAAACLDFPCDLADLAFVLDRIDLKRELASKSTRRSV